MKVTAETKIIPANKIVIELEDMEAGYLRTILHRYTEDRDRGFAAELVELLKGYSFPVYERKFPNWADISKD